MQTIIDLFNKFQELSNKKTELLSELTALNIKIDKINDEMIKIEDEVKHISNVVTPIQSRTDNYNPKWTNFVKIKFILDSENKLLSAKEISDKLIACEPEGKEDPEKARAFYATISGVLSSKVKDNILFKRIREYDGGDYIYGLKEWFNDNNEPLDRYK